MASIPCSSLVSTILRVCLLLLAPFSYIPVMQFVPGLGGLWGGQGSTEVVAATNHGFVVGPWH